jgi:Zn-dependent protease with chaperone function
MSTIEAREPNAAPALTAWSSAERDSFFAAVARHRRASWRVTLAAAIADALLAFVVALLMSPIFYAAIALALDLVNLVHHTPNFVTTIARALQPILHPVGGHIPLAAWLYVAMLAALPGLVWMALVLVMLHRALRLSGMFNAGEFAARAPNPQILSEQRFGNVIEEMALAATVPPPRVLIAEGPQLNAAVFGSDDRHATVLVSQGLLAQLNRDQLQGVAAQLVGSIADGDMAIGLRAATTLSLFAFIARFAGIFGDQSRARSLARLCLAMLRPSATNARNLAKELTDPFRSTDEADGAPEHRPRAPSSGRTWRDWVWLPLMGPIVMTGFFAGLVNMFFLSSLVAVAWRQRKYMADATAVRLTRDPDTLAGALRTLESADSRAPFAAWAAHFSVVAPGRSHESGFLGGSVVPLCPSVTRRLRALRKMGAHVNPASQRIPAVALLIIVPLCVLLGGLMALAAGLMAYVSIPLSALFLGVPFAIIHALLRWIGGG